MRGMEAVALVRREFAPTLREVVFWLRRPPVWWGWLLTVPIWVLLAHIVMWYQLKDDRREAAAEGASLYSQR
jgi:hypothetical protein